MKYTVTVTKRVGWFGRVRTQTTAMVESDTTDTAAIFQPPIKDESNRELQEVELINLLAHRLADRAA